MPRLPLHYYTPAGLVNLGHRATHLPTHHRIHSHRSIGAAQWARHRLIQGMRRLNTHFFGTRVWSLQVCGSTRTRGYTQPDPYPRVRVWSHRSGVVRVRRPRVRVYPVLPVNNTILQREPFYFCMFAKLLMMKQFHYCSMARENSILLGAYNRLLTISRHCFVNYKKAFDSCMTRRAVG